MRVIGFVAASLLAAAGCVPEAQLRPSTGAQLQQGDANAARAEASGVVLVADGAAWKGTPSNLEHSLTPVRVLLVNRSGRPLRLEYGDFSLVSQESRFRYSAVPPMEMGTQVPSEQRASPGHAGLYLGVGPGWGYGPYGAYSWYGWGPYGQRAPFVGSYNPFYPYSGYGGYSCEAPLPTQDMLQQALPEGVLEVDGRVEGFLYFQGVAERERQVVLQARLVDGKTDEAFGTLDIPFQVRK